MTPAAPADPAPDARATILVVNDDDVVREVVSQVFTDEDYQVRQAADGLAALEVLDTEQMQLVLADVQLPRLGGVALAHLLRARVHPVPAVLMGAVRPRERLPGVPYLAKPFLLDHLVRVMAEVLAPSGSRRGPWRRGEVAWSRG